MVIIASVALGTNSPEKLFTVPVLKAFGHGRGSPRQVQEATKESLSLLSQGNHDGSITVLPTQLVSCYTTSKR